MGPIMADFDGIVVVVVREFIVLTMTTAAMYSVYSLDVWERVTLGLAKIWVTDLPYWCHIGIF